MSDLKSPMLSRRLFLGATAALAGAALAAPALAQTEATTTEADTAVSTSTRRNISSFRSLQWQISCIPRSAQWCHSGGCHLTCAAFLG